VHAPGPEGPHEPAPSLWPVGFAIGIACILVGLVVSWPAVAVGAFLTVAFGFLWARDVMAGARRPPEAPDAGGPPPSTAAPPIPAHVGEPAMPEPSEEELELRFPRSKFLEGATLGIGAAIGGLVTVPALGLMVAPAFVDQGQKEVDLGPLDEFPEGEFTIATFLTDPDEGEVSRRTAYIRNNGDLSFTIISNRCVHLGCPVQPTGLPLDDEKKEVHMKGGLTVDLVPVKGTSGFACPCHGGAYDKEGNRTSGPPVRSLDRYAYAIKDGHLVLLHTYSVGKVKGEGADAKIVKYSPPAGPGVHVDGPEAWLYPVQAPH
jgi:Rieske Fe-S protein